ncbi:hypothetical protein [Candidatus Palauibacter sp.]|uniref:hypothetical protein n=1 Tax=Candidatus Palauibacter sp. TaxID=3101350 RepID=UPI003B01B20C
MGTACAGISPTASGARLGTVTWKRWCAAKPCGSRAVTAMVTMPPASALTTTERPDTEARATPAFDEDAA